MERLFMLFKKPYLFFSSKTALYEEYKRGGY
nr:MAG TPA: hypothetical protein [Caudoviricetes sp.]